MNSGIWTSLAQTIAVAVGAVAACVALLTYRRNARLERARWISNLHAKFYEQESNLKAIREQLDCAAGKPAVDTLVTNESAEFTDYLNFFEMMAYLKKSGQLDKEDVEAMFGYYLDCLSKHRIVVEYVQDETRGYEYLREHLAERKQTR